MEFHSMQVSPGHLARAPASAARCGAACAARTAVQNGCSDRPSDPRRRRRRRCQRSRRQRPGGGGSGGGGGGGGGGGRGGGEGGGCCEGGELLPPEAQSVCGYRRCSWAPGYMPPAPPSESTRTAATPPPAPPTPSPPAPPLPAPKHHFNRTACDGGGGGGNGGSGGSGGDGGGGGGGGGGSLAAREADAMSSFGVVIPDNECLREVARSKERNARHTPPRVGVQDLVFSVSTCVRP